MNIFLIGSGNVATQLGFALQKRGHKIVFVYSRNIAHAEKLGKKLKTRYGNMLDAVRQFPAEAYMVAIKDDAIADVVKKISPAENALVFHTSGATPLSVLKRKFRNCGVLWPVQTISQQTAVHFRKVPLIIEANNHSAEKNLRKLAHDLSDHVYAFNSRQRKILHLAAVWLNNFPNHLFFLAEQLLKKHKLPFELFHPLILSTAQLGIKNPRAAQTGPAQRNDRKTMREHLKLLSDNNYKVLYQLISKSIITSAQNR